MLVQASNFRRVLALPLSRFLSTQQMSRHVVDLLAISAVLGAMVAANVEWLFTREGWVDTWMYFGYFQHYDFPYFLAHNKKIARLPWVLLGFADNKAASAEAAAFILHLGIFALGAIAFYRLAQSRFGRKSAVVATLAYITWVPLHGSGGWDYHNTLTPLLYFFSHSALIAAARSAQRPFVKFFKFSFLWTLAVHTNVFVLLLTAGLALEGIHCVRGWFFAERKNFRSWLYGAIGGMACGAVSVTIVLGLINVAFGRSFLFFAPLIARTAFLLANSDQEGSWLPWSDQWWIDSFHTAMMDAVLALVVVRLVFETAKWSWCALVASDSACAKAEYLIGIGVFAVGQSLGHPLLQPAYMAMPLAMPMFLAVAALIFDLGRSAGDGREGAPAGGAGSTAFGLFAALAFGLQFVGRLSIDPNFFAWLPPGWLNVPPILVIFAGYLIAELVARLPLQGNVRLRSRTLAFGCFAIALGQANTLWPIAAADRAPYDYRNACTAHRSILSDVAAADKILFPMVRAGRNVVIWAKAREYQTASQLCRVRASDVAIPLIAMGYADLASYWTMDTSEMVADEQIQQIKAANDVLAIITNDDEYVQGFVDRLRQKDPHWRIAGYQLLGKFDFKFKLQLIAARSDLGLEQNAE